MNSNGMSNYGPEDFSWELWHRGPVFDRENVILVHGFRFPWFPSRGKCDYQFGKLDKLLQIVERGYNVWQFEYASAFWGTYDSIEEYAKRLGEAITKIRRVTGGDSFSVIAYSMGGIIARQYIANKVKNGVNKLLTLAAPHMGNLRFQPWNLKWTDRILPRAAVELRPDSKLLWDLNTRVEATIVPEFAAIGGYSWGATDGLIELGSTSLVKDQDGSNIPNPYFTGVNRSHFNIHNIKNSDDEVFQLILNFLRGGVLGIRRRKSAEKPGDYNVPHFLTFALRQKPRKRMTYPCVVVKNTGHRYPGVRVLSQVARTDDGSYIYTVQLRPDDHGEARVYYTSKKYVEVNVNSSQSTLATEPIGIPNHCIKPSEERKTILAR